MNSDESKPNQEPEQESTPDAIDSKQPIVDLSVPIEESTVEEGNLTEESTVEDENLEELIPISLSLPIVNEGSNSEGVELNSPLSDLPSEVEIGQEIVNFEPEANRQNVEDLTETVAQLKRQEQELREKIATLQDRENKILSEQLAKTQAAVDRMLQEGLTELEQRKQTLQVSLEQLERRRERIRNEMRTSFAGTSQDIAIRVQGFKDYLVGSLQDLASAAEQLDLAPPSQPQKPITEEVRPASGQDKSLTPKFAEQGFQEQARQIRKILDQYRTLPDYYGPPWQLRRTFEPVHAERVANWFFTQGGRGAIKTMGSRLQNVLIASATISVMRTLYGDRLRTLIIANTPERLGEWRRGLQDCLGISRSDFGPERGIVLFEEASALVQKADRLLTQKQLPLVLIDETEDLINLSLLQFPLWLAFAPDPQQVSNYQY
jgi:vacuolar-type H+-ATPase subunit H